MKRVSNDYLLAPSRYPRAVRLRSRAFGDGYRIHLPPFTLLRDLILLIVFGQCLIICSRASSVKANTVAGHSAQASGTEPTPLQLGVPLQRELRGGQVQTYTVDLTSGQFLHVTVEQQGIDVAITLSGPGREAIAKVDSPNGQYGPEPVLCEAKTTGAYRLEVHSPNRSAPAGRYEIKVLALRAIEPSDRDRLAATAAFDEGHILRAQDDVYASKRTVAGRQAALKKYELAQSLFQRLGDRYWLALTLNTMGSTYAQLSDFRKALTFFNQALPIFQEVGDKRREAATTNFLGGAHDVLGDVSKALGYYSRAMAIADEVKDPLRKASILNNLGKIYAYVGDWQKAIDNYNQSLQVFRSLGDQGRAAIALNNLGLVYLSSRNPQLAADYAEQSLRLQRLLGNKSGEADSLDVLGYASLLRSDAKKALDYYAQSLVLRRQVGNPREEATTLDLIGVAHSALNAPDKALEEHRKALQLRRAVGDRRNEALTLANIAHVQVLMNETGNALKHYDEALSLFRSVEDRPNVAQALVGSARIKVSQNELLEARKSIEEALALIETVRASAGGQQSRYAYFASKQDAYKLYIELLMAQHRRAPGEGHDAEALAANERARARGLLELMNEAHVDVRQGVDAKVIGREHELMQMLNAKAQRQIQLLGQPGSKEQLADLNREVRALEEEYQQVQTSIQKASPAYAALTQPEPLNLRQIQQQLDPDTLLLEYSLGDERSYLWAVTAKSLKTYELPKREQIEPSARKVYELLTVRSTSNSGETVAQKQQRVGQADSQLLDATRQLSQMVLDPVAAELGSKRLVVIADEALQYVPFAALPAVTRQAPVARESTTQRTRGTADVGPLLVGYRPLILDHEIISLPSASALAVQRLSLAGRKPAVKAVAVIADPVFSRADERLKTNRHGPGPSQGQSNASAATRIIEHLADDSFGRLAIRRLRFTRQEAEQILAVAPRATNLKALDFKANRSTATAGVLSQYRYVHFATHGYLDSERPDLSAIVLSLVDEKGNPQDGFLRAREVYNLDLPAELVVLSACQTGLGKEIKGEGLVGLTRGFMYAGARRVVVSLWNVNDKATAELMRRFYQGMLREKQTPAAALRKAQVEMSQLKPWQSPYYWAAFVLQGEWR